MKFDNVLQQFIFWRVLSTGSCILAQLVYIALQLTEIEKDYIIVSRSTVTESVLGSEIR